MVSIGIGKIEMEASEMKMDSVSSEWYSHGNGTCMMFKLRRKDAIGMIVSCKLKESQVMQYCIELVGDLINKTMDMNEFVCEWNGSVGIAVIMIVVYVSNVGNDCLVTVSLFHFAKAQQQDGISDSLDEYLDRDSGLIVGSEALCGRVVPTEFAKKSSRDNEFALGDKSSHGDWKKGNGLVSVQQAVLFVVKGARIVRLWYSKLHFVRRSVLQKSIRQKQVKRYLVSGWAG